MESFKYSNNRLESELDLSASNKRNKGIREGINKTIFLVMDIIPGISVLATMPLFAIPAKVATPSKPPSAAGYLSTSSYVFGLHFYSNYYCYFFLR